jgi:hypothetical protein
LVSLVCAALYKGDAQSPQPYHPRSGCAAPPPFTSVQEQEPEPIGLESHRHGHTGSHFVTERVRAFPRLSKEIELMRSSYDCVVIGSGYGGGIAPSRMGRAGQTVCVLELGKEKWPGQYPSSSADALGELHVSGEFTPSWTGSKRVQ